MSDIRAVETIDPHRGYTFAEAAPYFSADTTERQVRRWVSQGDLPFTPLPGGRGRVLSGQQIIDYMDGHRGTRVPGSA